MNRPISAIPQKSQPYLNNTSGPWSTKVDSGPESIIDKSRPWTGVDRGLQWTRVNHIVS